MIREVLNDAFFVGDHGTHFFVLGGPDFIVGPGAPKAERNVLGVVQKVGREVGARAIQLLQDNHEICSIIGGRFIHPVAAIVGGVTKPMTKEDRQKILTLANRSLETAKFTLQLFDQLVLNNKEYVDLILSDMYAHQTYYMGLVDENNKVNFYDGKVRVVTPSGKEFVKYSAEDYLDNVAEHIETWTYLKFPYLKKVGWKGLVDGEGSGVYRASPLARLNVSDGMSTPLAQAEYEKFYATLGGKPVHATLATHWARLIELLFAVEQVIQLTSDERILDPEVHAIPSEIPTEGVAIIEAPRGTLTHHYQTDERGLIQKVNLIVGTTNNYAAIDMSIRKAAMGLIEKGRVVSDEIMNKIEMAFRAYDPCFGCATHALPGDAPMIVRIYDHHQQMVQELRRD